VQIFPSTPLSAKSRAFQPKSQMLDSGCIGFCTVYRHA
jgi:hypothetical protein